MAEAGAQQPGHAQVAINHVRLEKPGLYDLAAKTLTFANARLSAQRNAAEQAALHHYLRFNFKATLLSDEKQEQIVSVVLDVQAGHAVRDPQHLARLVSSETETAFAALPLARPRWRGAGDTLAPATVEALLLRAQKEAEVETARAAGRAAAAQPALSGAGRGAPGRLLRRAGGRSADADWRAPTTGEGERRSGIEAKIQALHSERNAKLADVQARYSLRVELELINLLLTVQPKLLLPVEIGNRRATVTRMAVWDPLLRRLEPLVCDMCGEPGEGLHLCTGGHLAHRACLAPQCVECNREYCRLCADQVLACVVCGRPVCQASSRLCPDCGRVTCGEHQKLCHAADGQPVSLTALQAPAPAKAPVPLPAQPQSKSAAKPKSPAKPTRPTVKSGPPAPAQGAPAAKAIKINVEIQEDSPRIVAFVMRSTNKVLATRTIELTPEGIDIRCECEKSPCPATGYLHRPTGPAGIQEQVKSFLVKLQQEYFLPAKRVQYYYMLGQQVTERPTLVLPPDWRDAQALAEAEQGFEKRLRRQ